MAALERYAGTGDDRKKVDVVHILLGSIVVLLLAVLTAGVQLYGVTVANASNVLSLKERFDKIEIPPKWFEAKVEANTHEIATVKEKVTAHIATDNARDAALQKDVDKLSKLAIMGE